MKIEELNPRGYSLTNIQEDNLQKLCGAITALQDLCGLPFVVTSGVRSESDQMAINPSVKKSAHLTGEAVDISDVDGKIYDFCINNIDILIRLGIYLESRTFTPRWIHMQIRSPKSGNRIFIP